MSLKSGSLFLVAAGAVLLSSERLAAPDPRWLQDRVVTASVSMPWERAGWDLGHSEMVLTASTRAERQRDERTVDRSRFGGIRKPACAPAEASVPTASDETVVVPPVACAAPESPVAVRAFD